MTLDLNAPQFHSTLSVSDPFTFRVFAAHDSVESTMPLPRSNVVRRHLSEPKRLRTRPLPTRVPDQNDSSSAYTPILLFNRLPIELQLEIFSHCLVPFPSFDPREAPLLITSVCRAWRALALNTPKLWSSFEIEVTSPASFAPVRDLHIQSTMQLWLARSKNYPLSVRLIHIPVGRVPDVRSARLLALLIPEARRWKHVQFTIPTSNMPPLPEHFPALQSLSLQLKGLWTSEPSVNVSTLSLPWHQLSFLDLQLEQNNLPSLDDWLSILSQTQCLKQCTVSANCSLDLDRDPDTIRLPLLEALHIVLQGGSRHPSTPEYPPSCFVKFLRHLSMPILRTFNVSWLVELRTSWSTSHASFLSFLHQISSTLRTLTISYLPVSDQELIACLTEVSTVADLHLRFPLSDHEQDPITNLLFSALMFASPPDDEGILLPDLASLDLQCNGSKFLYSDLLQMILSRWNKDADAKAQFNRFRLLSVKPTLVEVDKHVRSLTDQGMDISIDTLFVR